MGRNDREFFNSLAETWDTTRAQNPGHLAELVARTGIQPAQAVLDVGCGTGVLLPVLLQAVGPTGFVVGVDVADNMVNPSKMQVNSVVAVTSITLIGIILNGMYFMLLKNLQLKKTMVREL